MHPRDYGPENTLKIFGISLISLYPDYHKNVINCYDTYGTIEQNNSYWVVIHSINITLP